ncbi:MAG: glycoside hydrolase family 99-like domain-containing protein, partial [Methanomassiliicoccaceae archaeon]|nr:glycoside hydrolase family 99-like domain-containing protein [Methanomassiliicoccaceae archaeon]
MKKITRSKLILATVLISALLFIGGIVHQSQTNDAAVVDDDVMLGMYYFGKWTAEPDPIALNVLGLHTWDKIKPYSPDREPLAGWYESRDVGAMEQHIEWMADYGIDFMSMAWYWIPGVNPDIINPAVRAYLEAENRDLVSYSLLWCNHESFPSPTSIDEWNEMIDYWIDEHFSNPEYLQIDNKPVMYIFSDGGGTTAEPAGLREQAQAIGITAAEMLDHARDRAKERGLDGIYFVMCVEPYSYWFDFTVSAGADAITAYFNHRGVEGTPYTNVANPGAENYEELSEAYVIQWEWILKTYPNMTYFVPMTAGWERIPSWGGLGGAETAKICTPTPDEFESHLRDGYAAIVNNYDQTKGIGMLHCWNEFGEGTIIEPTVKNGFEFLERIQDVFRSGQEISATYTINYEMYYGTPPVASQTKGYNEQITLDQTQPVRSGLLFMGWGYDGGTAVYQPGDLFIENRNRTLYAVWHAKISFDANGGEGAPDYITRPYVSAPTILPSEIPTRSGHVFLGWSEDPNAAAPTYQQGGDYTKLITVPVMLYAVWEEIRGAEYPPNADDVIMLNAIVSESPAEIRLEWLSKGPYNLSRYDVYRKSKDAAAWGQPIAILSSSATYYVDTNVTVGQIYEYCVNSSTSFYDAGYITAGIKVPAVEYRGKVVLLVEAEQAAALSAELETLKNDLIGDGWTVLRHDVSRNATPESAKALVLADYNADQANVKAVFLFGHIPVFRTGNFAPDGHAARALPGDSYYGTMTASWDLSPGRIPGTVQLQVGRVDFDNMPAFSKSATELLRQYLNKDHQYRIGQMTTTKDALVANGFAGTMNSVSDNAYKLFPTLWGPDAQIDDGSWSLYLSQNTYTWGHIAGYGNYTNVGAAGGTLYTSTIANSQNFGMIFAQSFGSYFLDFDTENNLLRAFLATPDYGLTNSWVGRPAWYFHHMGLGETIGYSTRMTQNNTGGVSSPLSGYPYVGITGNYAHINLMGDPTLRMYPVLPAADLQTNYAPNGMHLQWTASADNDVTDYYVYGASNKDGPYTRLAIVQGTDWTHTNPGGTQYYMVRASELTTTGSGSFYNLSQGVIAEAASTYTVSGKVSVDGTTNGLSGVTITCTGALEASYITAADGTYAITANAGSTVVITGITKAEYVRASGTIPSASYTTVASNVDFTMKPEQVYPPNADNVVMLSAVVSESPATIRLEWPSKVPYNLDRYDVYRKSKDSNAWEPIASLSIDATYYVDTNVTVGQIYEYCVTGSGSFYDAGYVCAGINVPAVEYRGAVVLLVEAEQAAALSAELETLKNDLIGDGWTVLRHDVSRNATPESAKALVLADYNADPANVKAVFLFGHVPIFKSGSLGPDGHSFRSFPADTYYGTMTASWDLSPSRIPGTVQLQVGRVDFDNMPAFSKSDTELLRQYLNKDHQYRIGQMTTTKDALVANGFAGSTNSVSNNAYRLFPALWGPGAQIDDGSWSSYLSQNTYTWAHIAGGGSYTSVGATGGSLTTSTIANSQNFGIIFAQTFGSYFVEWDTQNNLLRAFLATPDYGLTNAWVGRPSWYFHHMGLGETIGYSARLTQNNTGGVFPFTITGYPYAGINGNFVHINLMGDPTLRMYPVLPATDLQASGTMNGMYLQWTASADSGVADYYVYGASNEDGPYTRLAIVQGTDWTHTNPGGTQYYMVRASELTVTGSGSFYNLSQGVIAEAASTYTVSGKVTLDGTSAGISDVAIYCTGAQEASYVTAADGTYTITANAGSTVTITGVSKLYHTRISGTVPASYTTDASDVNFTMRHDTFTVSGRVSLSGTSVGLSGVTIYCTGALAESYMNAADGTYTITANVGQTVIITGVVRANYLVVSGSIPSAPYTASVSNINFALNDTISVLALSAQVSESPATIRVEWPGKVPYDLGRYDVYRKDKDAMEWGPPIATLSSDATFYVDTNVTVGQIYEYCVNGSNIFSDAGYISTGIKIPAVEYRGKVVLLVEAEQAAALSAEIETLKNDLIGDGWGVLRHDVSRNATPESARALVQADYNADPANVKAVFLLGHIPVLRTANFAPDGHDPRPLPSDLYYGAVAAPWDSSNSTIREVQLQVGRVDFNNMPAFSKDATELLRQYLNKDHQYRIGQMTTTKDALISDGFAGTVNSVSDNAYRLFPTLWGPGARIDAGSWSQHLSQNTYTWAHIAGGGTYTSVGAIGGTLTTSTIASSQNFGIIFAQVLGSYFVDFDRQDNLLRAFIATSDYGLASAWVGRPDWYFHHMALGETIGYSVMLTQNNYGIITGTSPYGSPNTPYISNVSNAHINLIGDPTLHMYPVLPATDLQASGTTNGTHLQWTASADSAITDYYIYGATNKDGPYTRLAIVQGTDWTHADPGSTRYYMVRASQLTTTGSGSFYNLSQGMIAETVYPFGTYTVSGRVTLEGTSAGVSEATISCTGALAGSYITAADGTYTITASAGSTVVITGVSKNYYTMVTGTIPASYTTDASGVNFTMSHNTFTVSGKVTINGTSAGIGGATITCAGALMTSYTTAADGTYTITANAGSMVVITSVSLAYHVLVSGTVPSASYRTNASDVNFTVEQASYGYVNVDGSPGTHGALMVDQAYFDLMFFSSSRYEMNGSDAAATGGWYYLAEDALIAGTLFITGDVSIIIADGCTLTVTGSVNIGSIRTFAVYSEHLPPVPSIGKVSSGNQTVLGSGSKLINTAHIVTNAGNGIILQYTGEIINGVTGTLQSMGGPVIFLTSTSGGKITNYGNIASGGYDAMSVGAGAEINNYGTITGSNGISLTGNGSSTIMNWGTISGNVAIAIDSGNVAIENKSGGYIGVGNITYGISAIGGSLQLTNEGTISGAGNGVYVAQSSSATIHNYGMIRVYSSPYQSYANYGIIHTSSVPCNITNYAGGGIEGYRGGINIASGAITNNGTVTGTQTNGTQTNGYGAGILAGNGEVTITNGAGGEIQGKTYGIYASAASSSSFAVSNSGTIEGEAADGIYTTRRVTITNEEGAEIKGGGNGILTGTLSATFNNYGLITGNVTLDDTTNTVQFGAGSQIIGNFTIGMGRSSFGFTGTLDQSFTYSTVTGNAFVGDGNTMVAFDDTALPSTYAGETIILIGGGTVSGASQNDTYVGGTHTYNILIKNNQFIAQIAAYGIEVVPGSWDFGTANVGYGSISANAMSVNNVGNLPTGDLSITPVSGSTSSFTLSSTSIGSIPDGGSGGFTVKPNDGLPVGTYTAVFAVGPAAGNTNSVSPVTFTVTFTVNQDAFTVSGKVSIDGTSVGLSGVTITCTGALAASYTTAADGTYTITANAGSAVVITGVSMTDYILMSGTVPSASYTASASDVNFTMRVAESGYTYVDVDGTLKTHASVTRINQSYFSTMDGNLTGYNTVDGWYFVEDDIVLDHLT